MSAFADYLDLRTAVLEQTGKPHLADVFDQITKLAESALNRHLRCREMVSSASLTVSNGSATLPSDFREVIGVYDSAGREYVIQPLQAENPTAQTAFYAIGASTLEGPGS